MLKVFCNYLRSKFLKTDQAPRSNPAAQQCSGRETLVEPRISGPTREDQPRVELTAKICAPGGQMRRVHIYTTKECKWGPSYVRDMQTIKTKIEQGELTQAMAFQLRDAAAAAAQAAALQGRQVLKRSRSSTTA